MFSIGTFLLGEDTKKENKVFFYLFYFMDYQIYDIDICLPDPSPCKKDFLMDLDPARCFFFFEILDDRGPDPRNTDIVLFQ